MAEEVELLHQDREKCESWCSQKCSVTACSQYLTYTNACSSRTQRVHAGILFPLTFSSPDVWICVVSPFSPLSSFTPSIPPAQLFPVLLIWSWSLCSLRNCWPHSWLPEMDVLMKSKQSTGINHVSCVDIIQVLLHGNTVTARQYLPTVSAW